MFCGRCSLKADANFKEYADKHARSLAEPDVFWREQAAKYISWFAPFSAVSRGTLEGGDIQWFCDGKLNVSHVCIDRHILAGKGEHPAIIWEGDEVGTGKTITFNELHNSVCRIANAMLASGVAKGDTVCVYMPMVPELAMVMLACARIGAVHSVVFAGFSAESLRDRIVFGSSKWVFVNDEGLRGGRTLPLKGIVDAACKGEQPWRVIFYYVKRGAGWRVRSV